MQNELDVIAAAVIGGTSFAGGIGTIPGAVLGAVVMQSLRSGMVLLRFDSPIQDIVVGTVLVFAVGLDSIIRRRALPMTAQSDPAPAAPAQAPARRDAQHLGRLRRRPRGRRGHPRPPRRRGRRPRRRQRRRQVDPHAHPVRRAPRGLGRDSSSTASRPRSTIRATPRPTASRRSTRRSPWPTTSMRRATCSSGAS